MKTSTIIKHTRRAGLAVATALIAASPIFATAGERQPAQAGSSKLKLIERRIEFPAGNGTTSSVTVWVPKTADRSAEMPATKGGVTKEIDLHSPNSPQPSITVWLDT